jgi:peroxiredoxin
VPDRRKARRSRKGTWGDVLDHRDLTTIHGEPVQLPQPQRLVHLQFRRYAGCPICNLHLRSITRRHQEILSAGVAEVVVFHSSAETMLQFQGELPFAAIADPAKKLYAEFGVESSPKAILNPRAWLAAARASVWVRSLHGAAGKGEEHLGLPADFLIGPDGRVLAAKFGTYAADQWSVDELLDTARRHHVPETSGPGFMTDSQPIVIDR